MTNDENSPQSTREGGERSGMRKRKLTATQVSERLKQIKEATANAIPLATAIPGDEGRQNWEDEGMSTSQLSAMTPN